MGTGSSALSQIGTDRVSKQRVAMYARACVCVGMSILSRSMSMTSFDGHFTSFPSLPIPAEIYQKKSHSPIFTILTLSF
jgi:hypothetical protein